MALRALLLVTLALLLGAAFGQPEPELFDTDWLDRRTYAVDVRDDLVDLALRLDRAPVYHLAWSLTVGNELHARQEVRVVNGSQVPWRELHFHLLPNLLGGRMTVGRLLLNGAEAAADLDESNRLLTIGLPEELRPGAAAVVSLEYHLEIPRAGGRNYGILGYRDGALSLAHAYALLAVHGADGWDLDRPPRYGDLVHAESAFFRVAVDAPASLDIATGGRLLERRVEGSRQYLQVVAGPVRDFYLAAGESLETIEQRVGEVLVRGHSPAGSEAATRAAVEHAAQALEIFERRFGPYPYRELDVVVISTSALGVEFPGIIALRRELLSPAEGERWLESTVVHEVAHQWFYSLVGNDQVSEPWLDESLTQYLTLRYFLESHGATGYKRFREGLMSRWAEVDRRTVPIGSPVSDYGLSEYGAVVYGLGPLVVEWLAGMMERPVFDAFLRDYAHRFAFELVETDDFQSLAEHHCECELDDFFRDWIRPPAVD
ncbi:MAG: M1 family metallopeptidase [Trueperaceae bacterium]